MFLSVCCFSIFDQVLWNLRLFLVSMVIFFDRITLFKSKLGLQNGYKLSTGPFFVEKVRNITGLYLNPPDKAMVMCVKEKSQIQALDHT